MVPAALACVSISCSEDRPRNLLLISIDTLRPDHVGCYGFAQNTTPHIDALAREGARFEDVLSPVPLTFPAHASLLTGTIPTRHGVHDNLSSGLDDARTTLAELFREEGFRTGAIVSSFVLDSRFNLSQGFETYNDDFEEEHRIAFLSERKGDETTRLARTWLAEHKGERFFLFLHYYDAHDDYSPPPPFAARFPSDPYSGEVAFVDQQVGEVLGQLGELGLIDDTLVVLTSDHGEMLEEHGEATHGYFIYESALRVPLILRGVGIEPRVMTERVGLVDVAPTIASFFGLEFPLTDPGKGPFAVDPRRCGTPGAPRALRGKRHAPSLLRVELSVRPGDRSMEIHPYDETGALRPRRGSEAKRRTSSTKPPHRFGYGEPARGDTRGDGALGKQGQPR